MAERKRLSVPKEHAKKHFSKRGEHKPRGEHKSRGEYKPRGEHKPRRDSRDRAEKTLYEFTCDKCGDVDTVPFKPSGDKPLLCRRCFDKDDYHQQKPKRREDPMQEINQKLDRILALLEDEF